jgi:hypothetical protein
MPTEGVAFSDDDAPVGFGLSNSTDQKEGKEGEFHKGLIRSERTKLKQIQVEFLTFVK